MTPWVEPWPTGEAVRDALAALEERLGSDRRGVFCSAYLVMTDGILSALARGGFRDAAWVDRFTVVFAEYYRRAWLGAEGHPEVLTRSWRAAFDANRERGLVVRDLVVGMLAHIGDDLPLALAECLGGGEVPPEVVEARVVDYLRLIPVIVRAIDPVQDRVAERHAPGLFVADRLGGRADEWLTAALIWLHRRHALREARALLAGGPAAAGHRRAIEDRVVRGIEWSGRLPPSRRLRRVLCRLEQSEPRDWPIAGRPVRWWLRVAR